MLKTTNLAPDFDFEKLIEATAGFSGSDLKEICRNAAMIPVREYVRSVEPKDHDGDASSDLLGIDMEVREIWDIVIVRMLLRTFH